MTRAGIGSGPADDAAAGPITSQKREFFLCSHYVNFRGREVNPDRSFSLAIVAFCNFPLISISAEKLHTNDTLWSTDSP